MSTAVPIPDLAPDEFKKIAAAITAKLTGDDIQTKKEALQQIISRVLVRRTDNEILAVIEYHSPEINIPPVVGGMLVVLSADPTEIVLCY